MRWLGRRFKEDPGVVIISILSPAIVYFGMWHRIISYWPSGFVGFEKLLPCNESQTALSQMTKNSQLFFSKVNNVQAKALVETVNWGLLAVFFLAGTFVVYTLGRAVSSGDIINIITLRGSKGGALFEYLKVFILYSLYLSIVLNPFLMFMFRVYALDIGLRGAVALFVSMLGTALWGVAVALITLSISKDPGSALIALFGGILASTMGGKVSELLLPYYNLFFLILSDFKGHLSLYSEAGLILNALFIAGAYFIFERRDFG